MTDVLKSLLSTYPISGGSGKSFEDAIVFNPGISEDEYVDMEYEIAVLLFLIDPDIDEATFKKQSLYSKDGKDYDVLTYLASNFGDIADDSIGFEDKEIDIYFDITANFGKHNYCIPNFKNMLKLDEDFGTLNDDEENKSK